MCLNVCDISPQEQERISKVLQEYEKKKNVSVFSFTLLINLENNKGSVNRQHF